MLEVLVGHKITSPAVGYLVSHNVGQRLITGQKSGSYEGEAWILHATKGE